jgi:hypothetical protein
LPLPDAGETVTQVAGLLADHPHPAATVSATDPDAPLAGALTLLVDTDGEHAMPACETGIITPATVSVVLRDAVDVLAATVHDALPDPEPDGVTVSQGTGLLAFHAQPAPAVTATVPFAPDAGALMPAAVAVGAHASPACETGVATPATVSVVLREAVVVFGSTVHAALPDPEPDGVTVTQFTGLLAFHAQPDPAVTATAPPMPDAGALIGDDAAVGEQLVCAP